MDSMELRGKVVLITGGARGIGFETARLAREQGASVALIDLDPEIVSESALALGGDTIGLAADVTDLGAMEAAVAQTVERLGGIDAVIASAGITPPKTTARAIDPTVWEKAEADLGVSFIIPIDKAQVSTVAKLQSDINVFSGKCSFPPVTTIKDRGTIKVGDSTLNTISMSNMVQGRNYFNRMYSLQKEGVCYMFSFSSITLDPASKGLTGSNMTQAQNNNKAIVNSTDAAFTDMVKSFAFVTGPQGKDETTVSPAR